jgi:glycosyltransferase involved in cell wall biosynthesis
MKICILSAKLIQGGAGIIAHDVARGMAQRGHKVLFICSGESPSVQYQDGYEVRVLKNDIANPAFHYFNPALLLKLKSQLAEFKPDIIHVHNINLQTFSLGALLFSRKYPMVWTLHDIWPLCLVGWPEVFDCKGMLNRCQTCPIWPRWLTFINRWIKESIYRFSKIHIVCPSAWMKSLLKASRLGRYQCSIVYNGIDSMVFYKSDKASMRTQPQIPNDKKIILFCGGKRVAGLLPAERKGWKYLCEALTIVGRSRNDVHLLYVGDRLPEIQLHLDVPVIFAEDVPRANMRDYINVSDILVYPTLSDNQPLTVLEAMACKTPIVAAITGGIPEMIIPDKAGLLCPPRDSAALADKINYLLSSPEHGAEMAEAAYRRFQEMFTFDRMIDQYETVYRQTISCGTERYSKMTTETDLTRSNPNPDLFSRVTISRYLNPDSLPIQLPITNRIIKHIRHFWQKYHLLSFCRCLK